MQTIEKEAIKALKVHPEDNVGVALINLKSGEEIRIESLTYKLKTDVKAKHKFALTSFKPSEAVRMYNVQVGTAKQPIEAGEVITTFNVSHAADSYDLSNRTKVNWQPPNIDKWKNRTFMGYHRPDGQVGTMNYWLVFPLVFCENRNIETLKAAFDKVFKPKREDPLELYIRQLADELKSGKPIETKESQNSSDTAYLAQYNLFEQVDGVQFITHQGGCGGTREDSEVLMHLLAGYIKNPNVAGATVLSLGCQNAEVSRFREILKETGNRKEVIILDQQEMGTEKDLLTTATRKTFEALIEINKIKREPAPLSKLTIGLECGGSDGFSGISANPAIGHVSDLLVALGGKAILSEFPELCGVEQELINRIEESDKADKFVTLMRAYEQSAEQVGSGFDMNPSPGNIKDGLITDAMKSAGAAKKGGTSTITDILDYTEYAVKPGLNLLCTPGNDVESTTGLAGSGANIILFTTGLGTPTGNPVAPVVKLSSNSTLAERMPDIIDIDTGKVITGEKNIEEMGEEILEFIVRLASGEITSKAMELEQQDFIPWKRGVSL